MLVISVARNGSELGDFDLPGVLEGLATGYFLPTDLAWHEGLTEWILLPEVVERRKVHQQLVIMRKASVSRLPHVRAVATSKTTQLLGAKPEKPVPR